MGYQLKMSAEIYDWLSELRDSDPPAARLAAQALTALADGGDRLGPPLVTAVAAVRPRSDELAPALDQHYQDQLESLTALRRRVAQVATLRKNIELQLTEVEPPPDSAGLREQLAEAMAAEERLIAESQREQMRVDAFRTKKEVLKAVYTAAEAEHLIQQAQGVGDDAVLPDDAAGAAARLDEIIGQIEQELGLEAPAEDLMELRPGAPADNGIRILFAVEPPGTALLIAVLEGDDVVRDHYRDAVLLASEVLQEARAYRAREEAAHAFGDAQSFLEEFFPGRVDELRAGT
jgi:phage shock protein A